MKLLFFDLETTGVDFKKCAIIQIGAIVAEIDTENKITVLDSIDLKMRPRTGKLIDQRSLEVNEFTIDEILSWQDDHEAYLKFVDFLGKYVDKYNQGDKYTLVGYNNSHFDSDFLRQWFNDNNDRFFGSWFWVNQIDVMCEASRYLLNYRPFLNNFKLGNVASVLEIQIDKNKLHDGMYDILLTLEIFKKIVSSPNIKNYSDDEAVKIFNEQKKIENTFLRKKSLFNEETAWITV